MTAKKSDDATRGSERTTAGAAKAMAQTESGNETEISFPSDREILITRVFNAPRDRVFKAFCDPKLIPEWWGPARYPTTVEAMDVRPGGKWRYISRAENGGEFGFHGEYREVSPPERVSSTFEFEGMPGHVSVDTATFEDRGGKTKVTIRSVFASKDDRDGMVQSGMESGLKESHERFEALMAKLTANAPRGFTIERTFRAPPAKVWEMWTTRAGLEKWFTGQGWTSRVTHLDVRVGGGYEITMTDGKQTIKNHGTYTEVVPNRRLIYTWHFDIFLGPGDKPYDVPMSITFEAVPTGTKMIFTQGPLDSAEHTEGSRQGVLANFERLAKTLEG